MWQPCGAARTPPQRGLVLIVGAPDDNGRVRGETARLLQHLLPHQCQERGVTRVEGACKEKLLCILRVDKDGQLAVTDETGGQGSMGGDGGGEMGSGRLG